jgi:hypothetical protein
MPAAHDGRWRCGHRRFDGDRAGGFDRELLVQDYVTGRSRPPSPAGRSADYIWRGENGGARYIDCNCRLVGPMSAYLARLDLVELLLQVSSGKSPAGAARSWAGVRTYLGMQSLLGRGLRGGGRRELLGGLRRMQLIEREVIA